MDLQKGERCQFTDLQGRLSSAQVLTSRLLWGCSCLSGCARRARCRRWIGTAMVCFPGTLFDRAFVFSEACPGGGGCAAVALEMDFPSVRHADLRAHCQLRSCRICGHIRNSNLEIRGGQCGRCCNAENESKGDTHLFTPSMLQSQFLKGPGAHPSPNGASQPRCRQCDRGYVEAPVPKGGAAQ
jgi:hypothetical protein